MSLKNLSTAVRVYCAFAESETLATPATPWSIAKTIEVVSSAQRSGVALAADLQKLAEADQKKVLRYVGAFEPLSPVGETFEFADLENAKTFAERAADAGEVEIFSDRVVHVRGQDYALAAQAAATVGGSVVRDVVKDDFEKIDLRLPHDMLMAGLPVELVEQSILQAIEARAVLTEGLVLLKSDGPAAAFKGRLESFARPRPQPKTVFGIEESTARALLKSGILSSNSVAHLLLSAELGEEAGVGSVPADKSVAAGAPPDRGGVAQSQPDVNGGSAASSKAEPKKEPKAPTEIVPDQAKDPASGDVTLPDGTVVPQEVLKQALSKLLANLATQLNQDTVGGKPAAPKGDAPAEPTPKADSEAPKEPAPVAAGAAAPPSKTDTKAVAEADKSAPAMPKPPKPAKGATPPASKDDAPSKEEYTGTAQRPFPAISDPSKAQGKKAKKTDEAELSMRARECGVDYADIARAILDGELRSLVEDVSAAMRMGALGEISGPARAFISRKIARLRGEGKPEDQAAAIATDMARRAGYDVPASRGEGMKGTGAEPMTKAKKETSRGSLPMSESDANIAITVASSNKFEATSFHEIDMGEGVKARAGKLLDGSSRERIQLLTFPKPTFNEAQALDWIDRLRVGAAPQARRPELAEKKEEAGEQEELAQGAHAFEEASKSVASLKSSAFQLVTRDLVQIEALCQALDCKKSGRLVTKLRETFTELHEEIKKAYGKYMEAHDAFMAESKAPEPVSAEPLTMDTAAAMGVPASVPAAASAATPGMAPSVPAAVESAAPPVVESRVDKAVARLSLNQGVLERILDGESYHGVAATIAVETSDIGLNSREIASTHDRLRQVVEKLQSRVYKIMLAEPDRGLLAQVSEKGDVTERLYLATENGQQASIVESGLERVTEMLRLYGEVEHRLLADAFDKAMGRHVVSV